jgi:hypothetical protein
MTRKIVVIVVLISTAVMAIYFLPSRSSSEASLAKERPDTSRVGGMNSNKPMGAGSNDVSVNANTTKGREVIGLTFSPKDSQGRAKWADSLSRNPYERQSRLDDLQYATYAEVIEFPSLDLDSLKPSSDTYNPTMISLPGGVGGPLSVAVLSNNVQADGSGNITGTLAGDPASSVVLGFYNGETSGMIESADKVYFYDAFDGKAVIVRELDADKYRAATNVDSDDREDHDSAMETEMEVAVKNDR